VRADKLALALLLLGAPAARAWDPPQPHDYALLGASLALNFVDAWQSFDIPNHYHFVAGPIVGTRCTFESRGCQKVYDLREGDPLVNVIFGPEPNAEQFVAMWAIGAGVETGIWLVMPERFRWLVPVLAMTAEGVVVAHNFRSGLSLHF
jgi:hypothetical protein